MNFIIPLNKQLNLSKLQLELALMPVVGLSTNATSLIVHLNNPLSFEQEQQILQIIEAHSPLDMTEQVRQIVRNAINFGVDLIEVFATENILMGITQAGKTKAVSDYLSDVTRYAQTGSLYEVINEIDRLIALGIPLDLAPFVTVARMADFKQKVLNYLQG
jgi:hypothetical protein